MSHSLTNVNRRSRTRLGIVSLTMFLTVASHPMTMFGQDKLDKVKAVYIYNFGNYITWPVRNLPVKNGHDFVVSIVGKDHPVAAILNKIGSKKHVQKKRLVVKMITDIKAPLDCHILYIPADTPPAEVKIWQNKARGLGILVVGETPGFVSKEMPGMIGFRIVETKLRFDMNQANLMNAGLRASSKLLQLAVILIKSSVKQASRD